MSNLELSDAEKLIGLIGLLRVRGITVDCFHLRLSKEGYSFDWNLALGADVPTATDLAEQFFESRKETIETISQRAMQQQQLQMMTQKTIAMGGIGGQQSYGNQGQPWAYQLGNQAGQHIQLTPAAAETFGMRSPDGASAVGKLNSSLKNMFGIEQNSSAGK